MAQLTHTFHSCLYWHSHGGGSRSGPGHKAQFYFLPLGPWANYTFLKLLFSNLQNGIIGTPTGGCETQQQHGLEYVLQVITGGFPSFPLHSSWDGGPLQTTGSGGQLCGMSYRKTSGHITLAAFYDSPIRLKHSLYGVQMCP